MVNEQRLAKVALLACIMAVFVVCLGAMTRLLDAGLGCPDWPGCYGHLVAPWQLKPWAEMIHRYAVGCLSVFILLIVMLIMAVKANRKLCNMGLALGLVLALGYQIVLGAWTVTLKLLPLIVTQHLLGGFLIVSILWLIYLHNRQHPAMGITLSASLRAGLILFTVLGLILLVLQIMLGAWTSTHYAALSCPDFPFCVNQHRAMTFYFHEAFQLTSPTGVNYSGGVLTEPLRQTIHMVHRIGALVLTCYLVCLMVFTLLKTAFARKLLPSAWMVLLLLCVQLCLGISNVIFKLPLITAVLHTLVAVLLLLALLTFLCEVKS